MSDVRAVARQSNGLVLAFEISVTFVMRLARSLVLVEVLAAPRGLSLFVLFRPKTSLASSSFFLRSRSRGLRVNDVPR